MCHCTGGLSVAMSRSIHNIYVAQAPLKPRTRLSEAIQSQWHWHLIIDSLNAPSRVKAVSVLWFIEVIKTEIFRHSLLLQSCKSVQGTWLLNVDIVLHLFQSQMFQLTTFVNSKYGVLHIFQIWRREPSLLGCDGIAADKKCRPHVDFPSWIFINVIPCSHKTLW